MTEKAGTETIHRSLPAVKMLVPVNLHVLERLARLALGVAMIVVGWNAEASTFAFFLRLFAFYPLVTAAAGWCPVYALLRFHTNKQK